VNAGDVVMDEADATAVTELATDNCITAGEQRQQSPASHGVFNYPLHPMHNLHTLIIARKQERARSAMTATEHSQPPSLPRASPTKRSDSMQQ